MARNAIIHNVYDWSPLDKRDQIFSSVDLSSPEINFGIHRFNGNLWSSGYVGVSRLYDKKGCILQSNGKEHVLIVSSKYGMDPWKMLETVIMDDEYSDYIEELSKNDKVLFKVFYDQPLVRLAPDDVRHDSEILYALSFLTACYALCKKGLKKTMFYQEENFTSKIRGKINIKRNIRENTCRGRSDRFYCKFINFTEDNIENRILKSTLIKCKNIIGRRFGTNLEISKYFHYCMNTFRKVKSVKITARDFKGVNISGLYTYYKPLLQQARCIYSQKYHTFRNLDGIPVTKSVFTIPYMINMESLFEFYMRAVLKQSLDSNRFILERYSKKIYVQKDIHDTADIERGIHLMPYCIPDIIICNAGTCKPMAVIDAKYKPNTRSTRSDTHQLLAYVLLTGVKRCGFVFPGTTTEIKMMLTVNNHALPLAVAPSLDYYELILGNDANNISDIIDEMLAQ